MTRKVRARPRRAATAYALLFVAGLLGLGACEDPQASERSAPLAQESTASDGANGATFAEIKTTGTGCPFGTANTRISADGLVFTTTFSNYVVQVDPTLDLSVRDCVLDIALRVPEGRSYAVQSFSYAGYALLQDGVIGRQTASYYFSGHPVPPIESNRTELKGPFDNAYLFTDDVKVDQRVWSPCGVERNLQVTTRVQLFNDSPRRSGYMNMSSVDGSRRMILKLDSRPCTQTSEVTAPLAKVSQVVVAPSTVRRDQPFTVSWSVPPANGAASYRVQVRTPVSFGDGLVWESPEITGTAVRYGGPPLPIAGIYEVLVVARRGTQELTSDRVRLEVRDSVPNTLGKVTGLRVQPSPIQRDQPFVVSWARASGATDTTRYRVEVLERREEGFVQIASSHETENALAAFEPSILPKAGTYQIIVVARDGTFESTSDPLTVQVVDAGGADPRAALLGRYAVRLQSFWQTGDRPRPVRELYLAEFARDGDDIELRMRVCAQEAVTPGYSLGIVSPEAIPTFRRKVLFEGSNWRTDAEPVGVGYHRAGVPACTGRAGQTVTKDPVQRWIRGTTCRCPRTASSVPTLDDCRVVDPDGDGQPGVTYELLSPTRVLWNDYLVGVVRSHAVNGIIDARGAHSAQWDVDEVPYKMGCSASGLCEASGGSDSPCVSSTNRMEFAPLREPPLGQAEWSCATIRSSQSRLFAQPLLSTPSRCQTESVTDPVR